VLGINNKQIDNKEVIIRLAFNVISDEDVFELVEKNNDKCVLCGDHKDSNNYVCNNCFDRNHYLFKEIKKRYDKCLGR
jgi:hypothetical protein